MRFSEENVPLTARERFARLAVLLAVPFLFWCMLLAACAQVQR